MKRRRTVAPMEDLIHSAIVELLRFKADPLTIYCHIPNNPRSAIAGARLKKLGMLAGAPDLLIITPDGRPHFLEVKTRTGYWSEPQRHFAARCRPIGIDYAIVRSSGAAEELLSLWGALRDIAGVRRVA